MAQLSVREAARVIGVSDDTIRRWGEAGEFRIGRDDRGRQVVAGRDLARFLVARRGGVDPVRTSARNRLTGLVTAVERDTVMAKVDLQCGPFRVVSLMSREAADDLGLDVGSVAVAVVKSTTVIIESETPA